MAEKKRLFPSWTPKEGIEYWKELEQKKSQHLEYVRSFIDEERRAGRIDNQLDANALVRDFSQNDFEVLWADAVYRMLIHDDMRNAFERLENKKINPKLLFLCAARGYIGPAGSELYPPGKRTEWLSEVRETAIKLAGLIELSPLDNYLINKFQAAHAETIVKEAFRALGDGRPGKSDISSFFPNPSRLSGLLRELAKNAGQVASTDMVMPRPGDREARRAYFIKTVTAFLCAETGKPLRSVVTAMTSAAFNIEIEESQISRIAPVRKKDNR